MSTETLKPQGDRIRQAVKWISDTTLDCPQKSRREIIQEAERRFDLTPKECEFLNHKFVEE